MVTGGRTRPEQHPVYPPGTLLAGKYRVERTLGVGGFGVVLAALHEQLDERVAIKILLPQAATHPTAPSRFVREARAAAKIRSEHVARVKDVGTLDEPAAAGGGTPYMVMEYLEGEDLASLVKRAGHQPIADVCEWVLQACEAIAEAHGLGMVHRDLKPANLFLTHRIDGAPCVKVLDFGISKLATEGDKGMTGTAEVMGSPFYMSPEQMKSTRDVDVRADVWALGTILFELLAGAPPFDGETMTGLIVAIMQEPPRELAAYRADVPPGLRDAVLRCMQKDPAARWQDVLQLAHAIAPFAHPRAQASVGRIAAALGAARSSAAPSLPSLAGVTGAAPPAVTAIPATVPAAYPGAVAGPSIPGGATSGEFARSVHVRRGLSPAAWIAIAASALVLGGIGFAAHQLRGASFAYTTSPGTTPGGSAIAAPAGSAPLPDRAPGAPVGSGAASASSTGAAAPPDEAASPEGSAPSASAAPSPSVPAVASGRPSAAAPPPPPPPPPPPARRPGALRPPPGKNPPPPPPTSEPAAPPPPKPPSDPFGRPI